MRRVLYVYGHYGHALDRRVVLHLQLHVHTIEHMNASMCRAVQYACVQQYELSVVVSKLSTRKT
jgi:hypothetical protein